MCLSVTDHDLTGFGNVDAIAPASFSEQIVGGLVTVYIGGGLTPGVSDIAAEGVWKIDIIPIFAFFARQAELAIGCGHNIFLALI